MENIKNIPQTKNNIAFKESELNKAHKADRLIICQKKKNKTNIKKM